VGGFVEYRTAPAGPRNESYIGSGVILSLNHDEGVIVETGPGQQIWLDPQTDIIRPSVDPGQTAEVLP
jgi:hypothetical protein